jgi:hypothetical protein
MSNSTINLRRFQLLVAPVLAHLEAAIWTHRSNWHLRKFPARTHFLLSLYAHCTHALSANALLEELNDLGAVPQRERNLRQMLDFDELDLHTNQPITLNNLAFPESMLSVPIGCGAIVFINSGLW